MLECNIKRIFYDANIEYDMSENDRVVDHKFFHKFTKKLMSKVQGLCFL